MVFPVAPQVHVLFYELYTECHILPFQEKLGRPTLAEAYGSIGIASSDQVQRQQRRDEPVRENTHLVLDTLASRLRSYHLIVGVESIVFWVIRTQLIYIQSIVCTSG